MSKNKRFSDTSANRYSLALFELASESSVLDQVENNSNVTSPSKSNLANMLFTPFLTLRSNLSAANIIYKGAPGRYGGGGTDTVILGSGNDTITLDAGDDTITAGAGDDTIDGGTGTDIAIFSGNQADYSLTETGYATYQIIDNRGIEGTDVISNTETIRFADGDLDITPSGLEVNGTNNDDVLSGNIGNDLIKGNDTDFISMAT